MNSKTNFLERALVGRNEWWKYIIIFLTAFLGGFILGEIPKVITDVMKINVSKNLDFAFSLLPFVFMLSIAVIMIKLMHKRSFSETVNGTKKVRWSRVFFGFAVWFIFAVIYSAGDYVFHYDNYILQFDAVKFIPLFVISLIMIPIQSSTEAFLMQGYLAQGFGSHTHKRWLALLFPCIVFALLHIGNPEMDKFGFVFFMAQIVFIGLFHGLLAILDDGIELSMGTHTANNLFLSLFVTNSASVLQSDAVFEVKTVDPLQDLLSAVVIAAIVFFILYKKYNWNLGIMNKRVEIKD